MWYLDKKLNVDKDTKMKNKQQDDIMEPLFNKQPNKQTSLDIVCKLNAINHLQLEPLYQCGGVFMLYHPSIVLTAGQ